MRSIISGAFFVLALGIFFNYGHLEVVSPNGFWNGADFTIGAFAFGSDSGGSDSGSGSDSGGSDSGGGGGTYYPPGEDPYAQPPLCTLKAAPGSIEQGGSATLTWDSWDAYAGSIDHGVGNLKKVGHGTVQVTPTITTKYTATVYGNGGVYTCDTTVTVTTPPPPEKPLCTLSADPSQIEKGESSALSWTTQNATNFSINQGVGNVTPVSGGSKSVSPTATTLYTGTATGPGGSVTCSTKVTVTTPPPSKECKLEITKSVDSASTTPGSYIEYTISFKNSGNARCTGSGVKLIDVVDPLLTYKSETHSGNVTAGYGSDPVYKSSDRTLRWNAWDLDPGEDGWVTWKAKVGEPSSCSAIVPNEAQITSAEYNNFKTWVTSNTVNVAVTKDCGTPPPTCTLSGNPSQINQGGHATLSWTSTNATSASLDNGIGAIAPVGAGDIDVSPDATTTYVATFTGPGGEVTCNTKIKVKVPAKVPACTLSASPTWIYKGQSATLTWTSENVTSGSLDQGVGALSPVAGDSVDVSPEATTHYTAIFTGSYGDVSCSTDITVKNTPSPKKCELQITKTVSKDAVEPGDEVEYTINFKNVGSKNCTGGGVKVEDVVDARLTYVSETHSGDVDAGYGSNPIYKSSDRTLRWNANTLTPGESGWVKWKATVGTPSACTETIPNKARITSYEYNNFKTWVESNEVTSTVTKDCGGGPHAPVCTLAASPTLVAVGATTTLAWTSSNASTGSIDNSIGAVSPLSAGSVDVIVSTTTTYVATFTGPGGTVSCNATVTVPPPTTPHVPACTMVLSKGQISRGDHATLSWTGSNVTDLTIDHGIGATTTVTGAVLVSPEDNTTYTGTFTGPYGQVMCQASITVTTGGGGCIGSCGSTQQPPTVVLYQTPTSEPLAFISLAQVPYTGFPAGPLVTAIFYLVLGVWSAAMGYFFVYRGYWRKVLPAQNSKAQKASQPIAYREEMDARDLGPYVKEYDADVPSNLPSGREMFNEYAPVEPILEPQNELERQVEEKLFEERILISKSGMRRIGSAGKTDQETLEVLDRVIYLAKRNYPREDGWILLSDVRIDEVFVSMAPKAGVEKGGHQTHHAGASTTANAFIGWLLDGEKDKIFGVLRSLSVQGHTSDELLTDVLVALDKVYRARIEGGVVSDGPTAARLNSLATKQLEELVRVLSGAVDQSYSSSFVGAKLAVANALNLIAKWKSSKHEPVRSPFAEARQG